MKDSTYNVRREYLFIFVQFELILRGKHLKIVDP